MATITKPMALDESFNTTENTSRNVADVLAEGLDNIAESILPRAATEIPIESGSATNTKDYIDSGLSGKANTNTFARKSVNTTNAITVAANTIDTQDFTVNDSNYNLVVGFMVSNSTNFAIVQCYFENSTTIRTRVRNLANTSDSYQIKVFYI